MKSTKLLPPEKTHGIDRRTFIKQSVLVGSSILVYSSCDTKPEYPEIKGTMLKQEGLLEGLKEVKGPDYLPGAIWYEGENPGDGISYSFPSGTLADMKYITADMLAEGIHMTRFRIALKEGKDGRTFSFTFGVLNQCSLRVRLPLSMVDQNRWGVDREGAFLKPRCSGDRVDLNLVDRMTISIQRMSPEPSKFCITKMITAVEVPVIEHPLLPKGKLIDDIGQNAVHNWHGKTDGLDEMKKNLQERYDNANHKLPETMSEWGGWKEKRLDEGTGFFRTHYDGNRWWLIDPSGYYFWSSGIDCVRVDTDANYNLLEDALTWLPEREGEFSDMFSERDELLFINYMAGNFIRTFGQEGWRNKWAKIALDELKRLRVNTVGNWSEWEYAKEAVFPYVRPMSFKPERVKNIYRDFPDVYHPDFEKDALDYAQELSSTKDDPALIGYFMMNEPTWAFSSELPAMGMLYNTPECNTRTEFASFLKKRYADNKELSDAWKMEVSFEKIERGNWNGIFSEESTKDLMDFSQIIVEKYFTTLAAACRKVDPNHLNLGIRYANVPPAWAAEGMKSFDVFSMNCYREKVPIEQTDEIHNMLDMPIIIGEWHFGALDVGMPSSGIGHVHTQADRGKAYRVYVEDAAANPNCIGTHWFNLYDESALGRFDGENYNIGFLDVCNQPYTPLCDAAIKSHEAIYEIASGKIEPYADTPAYLPKLF